MNEQPLVSIIVPCYNGAKYLKSCIDSLVIQSYENIEIIIVNDGSVDNSGIIINECKRQDSRIKSVTKPNGGLPSARNSGIDAATGEYIAFVDADDTLPKDAISILLANMDSNTDLAVGSYMEKWLYDKPMLYSPMRIKGEMLNSDFLSYAKRVIIVCKNLYRKSIIDAHHLRFDESMRFAEDYYFNLHYLKCCQHDLVVTDKPVYNYYTYRSAQHRRYYPDIYLYYTRILDAAFEFFKDSEFSNEAKTYFAKFYLDMLIDYYTFNTNKHTAEERIGKAFQTLTHYFDESLLRTLFTEEQYLTISSENAEGFLHAYYGNRLPYLKLRAFCRKALLTVKRKLVL